MSLFLEGWNGSEWILLLPWCLCRVISTIETCISGYHAAFASVSCSRWPVLEVGLEWWYFGAVISTCSNYALFLTFAPAGDSPNGLQSSCRGGGASPSYNQQKKSTVIRTESI